MPDSLAVYIHNEPGSLIQTAMTQVGQYCSLVVAGGSASFSFGAWNDQPAIIIDLESPFGGFESQVALVLWCVHEDPAIEPGLLLTASGWNCSISVSSSTEPYDNIGIYQETYEAFMNDALGPFILMLTGATMSSEVCLPGIRTPDKWAQIVISYIMSFSLFRSWTCSHAINFNAAVSETEPITTTIFGQGETRVESGSISSAAGSGALDRIADALESISLMDVDIGINRGATIFSVRGRATTGE